MTFRFLVTRGNPQIVIHLHNQQNIHRVNYLNLDIKIYARKCTIIRDISKEDVITFLDNNHILV